MIFVFVWRLFWALSALIPGDYNLPLINLLTNIISPRSDNSHTNTMTRMSAAGNLDVENLSQNLYDIWIRLCAELHANSNELRGTVELEQVFSRAGISMRVAEPLSEEIFEKLRLDPEESSINFQQFIGLIQTEDNVMYFANNCTNPTINLIKTTGEERTGEDEDEEKGREIKLELGYYDLNYCFAFLFPFDEIKLLILFF